MRILALEPYYGGSHKAFLDGWSQRSRHEWTVLHLPPRKWKWRMRHAAVTLADMAAEKRRAGSRWDLIFCSDMLSLADFLGLARRTVGELPSVAYFHENQLTYPVRHEDERDFHYGLSNMMTALAADGVWFNTDFHRDSFLEALGHLLKRMPDYRGLENVERIRRKSCIQPQGIEPFPPRGPRHPGPARILWAARWEHDKDPQTFFQAVEALSQRGVDFRLSVIGEMSAVLAHEIRNPLTSLKGHAQLLVEQLPDESPERRKAERVIMEVARLEALTADLLDFVRSGPLELTQVDPAELLRASAQEVDQQEFELELEASPGSWPLDARRLRQALTNLLRNARQASPQGVRPVARVCTESGCLVFTVRDFGEGLPKGQEDRVFDPFFTTKMSGTGLGLSVARRIAELHGGSLTAENHPEGGAVFRVELPEMKG